MALSGAPSNTAASQQMILYDGLVVPIRGEYRDLDDPIYDTDKQG